jgi:hypothetical protein
MLFMPRLKNRHISARKHARRSPVKPRAFHPRSEFLEGRALLSTLTVTSNLGWGSGTLRAAVYQANSDGGGDTIKFALNPKGDTIQLATSEIPFAGAIELLITKDVTIQGPGAGLLAIDANGLGRAFEITPGAHVTISGLEIEHGDGNTVPYSNYADGFIYDPGPYDNYGGGVLNRGTLTLSGCTVTGNRADPDSTFGGGGGVANFGTMTMSGCTVTGNSAYYGGGVYNTGTLTVLGSTVTQNTAIVIKYDDFYSPGKLIKKQH